MTALNNSLPKYFKALSKLIFIAIILFVCFIQSPKVSALIVAIEWDPNPEPGIAGYLAYCRPADGQFSDPIDVGNVTMAIFNNLAPDTDYVFAARAYNEKGVVSPYSELLPYHTPSSDTDNDDIPDEFESGPIRTDPEAADTDSDGIADGAEMIYWAHRWKNDFDSDGIFNLMDPDSDNDGILDGAEIHAGTDPANPISIPPTIYFNAENGLNTGWDIYDDSHTGASLINIYDEMRQSRVVQLIGSSTIDGFRLSGPENTPWRNENQTVLEWSLQYTEHFIVYVDLDTTAGHRYLYYSPADYSDFGTGEYVRIGLGSYLRDGRWHTIVRDLQTDLERGQPGVQIIAVNGFLIRGPGRLDDILLHSGLDPDGDGLTLDEEIRVYGTDPHFADTDHDGIADDEELAYWGDNWNADPDNDGLINLLDPDSDNDGVRDCCGAVSQPAPGATTASVYEDAQDGGTDRWRIYDGNADEAVIKNVFDEDRKSQVIELTGNDTIHGFQLTTVEKKPWQNSEQLVLEWSHKFIEFFIVYVDVETSLGHRYLKYTPVDYHGLGTGEYAHFGTGGFTRDGTWHTIVRDLQADLKRAQPGAIITAVNGFLIRGSGCLDNIKLHSALDADGDGLPVHLETNVYGTDPNKADTDGDGLDDGKELAYWKADWSADPDKDGLINLLDEDSDNDGVNDGEGLILAVNPNASQTVYEDAEDGSTDRWIIYDDSRNGVQISNIFDPGIQSNVIELAGTDTLDGFQLKTADQSVWKNADQFVLSWRMNHPGFFIVYIDVMTTLGHRYLKYTPADDDGLGSGEYVHFGLGGHVLDGEWHTIVRDLEADLERAQPGSTIIEVNGFLIRGSGRLDEIALHKSSDSLNNTLALENYVVISESDLLSQAQQTDQSNPAQQTNLYISSVPTTNNTDDSFQPLNMPDNPIIQTPINENDTEKQHVIPQSAFTILSVSSEELNDGFHPADHAVDGDIDTFWLTERRRDDTEAERITIDLGSFYRINGFFYLPRQDSRTKDNVFDYRFYVNTDGISWDKPVAQGKFLPDRLEKQVLFEEHLGRYIRFEGIATFDSPIPANVSELNILGTVSDQAVDADKDGLLDQDEKEKYRTDPDKKDTDEDRLNDAEELRFWGMQWNSDFDGDSVINLLDNDADGDGHIDGLEIEKGFDPEDSTSRPNDADSDIVQNTEAGLSAGAGSAGGCFIETAGGN